MLRSCAPLVSHPLAFAFAFAAAGCRLGPLVDDQPGASANILPASAVIPDVSSNVNLVNQITINDNLDSDALAAANNVIQRVMAGFQGEGTPAKYWPFGTGDRAPAPIYLFGTLDPSSGAFTQSTAHPPLVAAVPGDAEYEPFRTVFQVAFTSSYAGEKITTAGALSDAIELKLVEEPVAAKVFIDWPIVRPGTRLDVGGTLGTVPPTPIYAHGYLVDSYPLGGGLGMQPLKGLLPTFQVSFLRGPGEADFDRTRPIFQAAVPPKVPMAGGDATYSAAGIEVDVDLKVDRSAIDRDSKLFTRADGDIVSSNLTNVLTFTVTTHVLNLPLQFAEGAP